MTVSTGKRPVTNEPALRKSGMAGAIASAAAALFVFGASDAAAASYQFGDRICPSTPPSPPASRSAPASATAAVYRWSMAAA